MKQTQFRAGRLVRAVCHWRLQNQGNLAELRFADAPPTHDFGWLKIISQPRRWVVKFKASPIH